MEKKFDYRGQAYVVYREHGINVYVNGKEKKEYVLRRCTEFGREYVSKLYVPVRQSAVSYAQEWLAD